MSCLTTTPDTQGLDLLHHLLLGVVSVHHLSHLRSPAQQELDHHLRGVQCEPVGRLPVDGVGHDAGELDSTDVGDHVVRVSLPVQWVAPGKYLQGSKGNHSISFLLYLVLCPQTWGLILSLGRQSSTAGLTHPLGIVADEPVDGLESLLAVAGGQELGGDHLTEHDFQILDIVFLLEIPLTTDENQITNKILFPKLSSRNN